MDICPNNRPETEFLNTSVIFKSDYSVISYFIDNLTYLKQTNAYKLRKKMFFFFKIGKLSDHGGHGNRKVLGETEILKDSDTGTFYLIIIIDKIIAKDYVHNLCFLGPFYLI